MTKYFYCFKLNGGYYNLWLQNILELQAESLKLFLASNLRPLVA